MQQHIELIDGKFVVRDTQMKKEVKPVEQKPIIKKEYSKEALELRDRVIKGNQKLFAAWKAICELDHGSQEWDDEMEKWHQATKRLSMLCDNLRGLGYWDCLYLEGDKRTKNCLSNPDGFFCLTCPSEYSYWEKEAGETLFKEDEKK